MDTKGDIAKALFNPFESEDISPPFSDHWEAKRRVAQAIRELTDVLLTSAPATSELHSIAEQLEQQTEEFSRCERIYGMSQFIAHGEHGGHGEVNHELNGVAGWSNPVAPGLNMWFLDGTAYGTVNCGYAYEGPPGHIHGGHVAAIFDQFLGMAQLAAKNPGMTGSLTVRYLKPTPLNVDLDLQAEVLSSEGRKTRMRGEIRHNGTVTATCEGLFIRPRNFAAMHTASSATS